MNLSVSVVIPTFNAQHDIGKLLDSIIQQTVHVDTICIIDSTSTDETVSICESYGIHPMLIPQCEFDHGGTRKLAIQTLNTDVVVLFTQDAVLSSHDALKNIISMFSNPDVAAVCGRQLPRSRNGLVSKHLREYNYPDTSSVRSIDDIETYGIKTIFLSDSFSAYRMDDLKGIGLFKENVLFGEDSIACAEFILKGKKVAYAANAAVYHSHDYTLIEEFKRYFDVGAFHAMENDIFSQFPSVEGEGGKYVVSLTNYLLKNKGYFELIELPFRITSKYLGYKLGKNYQKLPNFIIPRLSMAPWWWRRQEGLK